MKIPKTIHKDEHTYTFVKICNQTLILYESELGYKETFSIYDLGLTSNDDIDKKIGTRTWSNRIYILYDNMTEKEKQYNDIHSIAKEINISYERIRRCITCHEWIKDRWFIERRYI